MTSVWWYVLSTILSLIGAIFTFDFVGQAIAENSNFTSNEMEFIGAKILEAEQWFLDTSVWNKIFVCLGMAAIIAILVLFCRLDEHFRRLPKGEVLENIFGESPFEEHKIFRLLPGMLFTLYIMVRVAVSIFNEDVNFDIINFSFTGQGYTVFEWITQIFYFLIIFAMITLILDSFLSAGFIGGIFHLIAVTTANIVMLFLGFIIGTFGVLLLALLIVLVIVLILLKFALAMFGISFLSSLNPKEWFD